MKMVLSRGMNFKFDNCNGMKQRLNIDIDGVNVDFKSALSKRTFPLE